MRVIAGKARGINLVAPQGRHTNNSRQNKRNFI